MAISIEEVDRLEDGLREIFSEVERDGDRLECRAGSARLVIEGSSVEGSMPLHATRIEDVESVAIDEGDGAITIHADETEYVFSVPGNTR